MRRVGEGRRAAARIQNMSGCKEGFFIRPPHIRENKIPISKTARKANPGRLIYNTLDNNFNQDISEPRPLFLLKEFYEAPYQACYYLSEIKLFSRLKQKLRT
jgi:hypothetical protein